MYNPSFTSSITYFDISIKHNLALLNIITIHVIYIYSYVKFDILDKKEKNGGTIRQNYKENY